MAVVVRPLCGNVAAQHINWRINAGGRRSCAAKQPAFIGGKSFTGPKAHLAQALHDRHEAVIAQRLQLPNRFSTRLGIGLRHKPFKQVSGEFRNMRELGPRPLERGAKLLHKVPHARLATGNAIDEKGAHERPAQAGAEADGVVNFFDSGDAVIYKPQSFAPQSLQQPVRNEAVNFFAQHERPHAHGGVHRAGALAGCWRCAVAATHLHQWQQVNRVEGMPDDKALGVRHMRLKLCWQQARS